MARYKGVLTTGQVAQICQVAPRTVSKWFDSGRLKGYCLPGSGDRYIPVKELIRFMGSHGLPLDDLKTGDIRILIVDRARQSSASMLAALNGQESYEAQAVESAFAAGVAAARFQPHVILVNPSTPELRLADFRAAGDIGDEQHEIKLVAIASEGSTAKELRRQGYDDCLVRPFDIDDILRTIDALLGAECFPLR